MKYSVISSNSLGNFVPPVASGTLAANIDPLIAKYITDFNVAGSNTNGSLAEQRQSHAHMGEVALHLFYTLGNTGQKGLRGGC